MNFSPNQRFEDLFVRYWDDALTEAESAEWVDLLASEADAREWFQTLCLQAVAAADLAAETLPLAEVAPATPVAPVARWSRRRVLQWTGAGTTFGLAAWLAGRYGSGSASAAIPVRLAGATGDVTVRGANGERLPTTGPVPAGAAVTTAGPGSSVLFRFADGTDIALAAESSATVLGEGRQFLLHRGIAAAEVPARRDAVPPTLLTPEAALFEPSAATITLGRTPRATEVGVQRGELNVSALSGESLAVVRGGELLTVRADGKHNKQPIVATPDHFAWDLSRPLPEGWNVGSRELMPAGPVVVPELWFDPYHHTEMFQIRSDHQWARGFFRLFPESLIRVRYKAERPERSQLVICVRSPDRSRSMTGVLERPDAFADARAGQWRWLEVRAADMLGNAHAPEFGPPWVGFLVILNTYRADLGLEVAALEVTRPKVGLA